MSFLDAAAPDPGPDFLQQVRERCPTVFLVLFRNKNQNVVVYEAKLNSDGTGFDEKQPVEKFWLDVDPAYRKPKRDRGIQTDREELSFLERKVGVYDFDVQRKDSHNLIFYLKAQPQIKMLVKLSDSGQVKCFANYEGQNYYISHLYIDASENLMDLLNNIRSVQVHGVHLKTQQSTSFFLNVQK